MRKRQFALTLVAVMLAVSSCATDITPFATGGSKADGTVSMSYEYHDYEQPVIDWEEVDKEALSICQKWGYSNAEAFGGSTRTCVAGTQYGCARYSVTTEYQCSD